MTQIHPPDSPPRISSKFWLGILGIWILALALRFWGLGRFNTLVFDEIYFARFGHHYLTNTSFFDAHPPLGKYLIGIGIWFQGFNPIGFRWMNALIGSLIPLLGIGLAYQLTYRVRFALLAGFLLCLDGLLLVESRYALINIYILFFGLAAQLCLMLATRANRRNKVAWLITATVMFGATISVKWNGLGLLFGFHSLWLITAIAHYLQSRNPFKTESERRETPPKKIGILPIQNLKNLSFLELFILLPIGAFAVYGLMWIPHISQNPEFSFLEVNRQIFTYHSQVGSGTEIHPYCSTWFSWPVMGRTVSYFFELAIDLAEPIPVNGPPIPWGSSRYLYSVYAMGNPILWWSSTLALLGILIMGLQRVWTGIQFLYKEKIDLPKNSLVSWVSLYFGVNYGANLLPWARISRCAFIYHYLPASIFATLALAWWIDRGLRSPWIILRVFSWILILFILLGFLYWLPFFLGLPLFPDEWKARIWLESWI